MVMVRESEGGGGGPPPPNGGWPSDSPLALLVPESGPAGGKAGLGLAWVWRGERGGGPAGLYTGVRGGPWAESKEPGWE
jgi:hypothetical protein